MSSFAFDYPFYAARPISTNQTKMQSKSQTRDDSFLLRAIKSPAIDSNFKKNKNENRNSLNILGIGDRVRIIIDLDLLKKLQETHGGWNCSMSEVYIHNKKN